MNLDDNRLDKEENPDKDFSATEVLLLVALFALIVLLAGLASLTIVVLVIGFVSLVFIKSPIAAWATAITITGYIMWRNKKRHK